MPQFRYKAVTSAGEIIEGELHGADKASVVTRLHEMGHTPIRADAADGARSPIRHGERTVFRAAVGRRDLALLTRELATLLAAGLTLERALKILSDLTDRGSLRDLLTKLLNSIRGGHSFADALSERGTAFPRYYISMVRAGGAGGALDVVLLRLSEFMERAQALRESVRSALIYPAIVIVMSGAAVTVMLTVVLPQFTPLFEDAGSSLPPLTRAIIGAGDFVRSYGLILLGACVGLGLLVRQQFANAASRARWDAALLRIPLFGDLIAKADAARFGRTLGTLLANGVPTMTALGIVRETLSNSAARDAVDNIAKSLKEGEGLANPLAEAREFPPLCAQLVRVGEETGQLESMLIKIADIYDREVSRAVDQLLALLVPGLTLALGGLIAIIIGAILSAMFSVYDLPL